MVIDFVDSWWRLAAAKKPPKRASSGEIFFFTHLTGLFSGKDDENLCFLWLSNIPYSFCRFLILRTHQIHTVSIVFDSKFSAILCLCIPVCVGLICFLGHIDGSSGSERNNSEAEAKPKSIPRKEAPPKPSPSVPAPPLNVRMSCSHFGGWK